jgi:acetyltransferase
MQLIISYARAEGLRRIEGQVLRDNTTMLAMCRELGFSIRADEGDAAIANVALGLDEAQGQSLSAAGLQERQ